MTGSYKVALGASLVLFLVVVTYYLLQGSGQPERPAVDDSVPVADAPEQAPPPANTLADIDRRRDAQPALGSPQRDDTAAAPSQADLLRQRLMDSQSAANRRPAAQRDPLTSGPASPSGASPPSATTDRSPESAPVTTQGSSPAPLPWQDQNQPGRDTTTSVGDGGPTQAASTRTAAPSGPRPSDPAPANTTAAQPAPQRTYTVQAGDTLSSIATQIYGSERAWVDIAQANPTVDPIRLKVGQVLRLPSEQAIRQSDEPAAAAPGQVISYTVRSGDTLSSIAQQYYNDPSQWRYIFNANRQKLGSNPDAIRAGMQITIPPAPRAAE